MKVESQTTTVDILLDDERRLDELVAHDATVQLERLNTGQWFLYVERGNEAVRVYLSTKRGAAIDATYERSVIA